jgi:hypothetical protein
MNRIGSTEGHGGPVGPEPASAEPAPAEPAPAEPAPAEPAPAEPAPGPDAATGLPSACPVIAASYEPKDVSSGSQAPRSSDKETRPRTKPESLVLAFLLGISISFSVCSVYTTFFLFLDYRRLPFLYYRPFTPIAILVLPVGIAFIALVSSSLLLLIPWSRSNRIIRNCAIVLFASQVAVLIFSMADGLIFLRNLSALLGVMAVGLSGLGVALCVALLWIRRWPLAEKELFRQSLLLDISVALAGSSAYAYAASEVSPIYVYTGIDVSCRNSIHSGPGLIFPPPANSMVTHQSGTPKLCDSSICFTSSCGDHLHGKWLDYRPGSFRIACGYGFRVFRVGYRAVCRSVVDARSLAGLCRTGDPGTSWSNSRSSMPARDAVLYKAA